MDWTLIGGLIALAAVALLAGAGLGYWTAQSDTRELARTAWEQGFTAAVSAQMRRARPTKNPYERP